jgi:(2Fe-2S) ferredoxin
MARPVRVIVCINERLGADLDVPVVWRECLGRCEEGPMMRFTPAGPFFTDIEEGALEEIFTRLRTFRGLHAG